MKLRPAREQRRLEQDAQRCRKVRLCVPCGFAPVTTTLQPRGSDVVAPFNRHLERFGPPPFGAGPAREHVPDPEDIYFHERASQVIFLVPYLN